MTIADMISYYTVAGQRPATERGERGDPYSDELRYCEQRIHDEEMRAGAAGSPEAACVHEQLAMLYRSQLTALERRRSRALNDCAI